MDPTEQQVNDEAEAYAEAILFPHFAHKYDPNCRPPVWAEFRNDLMECVEYFRPTTNHPAYRSGAAVHGFLIDRDCGERAYIDSEVVIARMRVSSLRQFLANSFSGAPTGSNQRYRRDADPEDQAPSDVVVRAFLQTQQIGLSVVLVLGSKCAVSPVQLVDRYSVMDHFRVSFIWAEKSVRGKAFYKVRFDKIVTGKSWWTPNQPNPPHSRTPSPPTIESPCVFCNIPAPRIYAETWLCTNPSCAFFWHAKNGSEAPQSLSLDPKFLKQRPPNVPWFKPGFELIPNLMPNLLILRETGQLTAALRSLWRGIVCPQCRKCNPRIFWNVWTCDNCDMDYPLDPGHIELSSIITRSTVSYIGHPMIGPEWPKNDFAYHGPFFRQHYRVDRWILHENSSITLISPTASFNEEIKGPNDLWNEILASANLGNLGLRRGVIRADGVRTKHFFNHFGVEYDFSDVSSTPLDEAPECIMSAVGLLNQVGQAELGQLYQWPNQVSVNGYWSEMGLPWHTDGEEEIGPTISTLSLGGDAILRVRLQMPYYYNEIDMMNEDPIMGALDWKNLTELKHRWEAGEIEDEEYRMNPEVAARAPGRMRPQIDLPLIHGSIVIMTGKALTKYYEHSIEVKDSIRFSVTCRTIDEATRERILNGPRANLLSRKAGQKILVAREKRQPLRGDGNSEQSASEGEDNESRSAQVIQKRGALGSGDGPRGPVHSNERASPNISVSGRDRGPHARKSRSASPSGIKKHQRHGGTTWYPEDNQKLKELVWHLGHKWTEISQEFQGKSPAACRLHYMLIDKGMNRNKNKKSKNITETGKAREGCKPVRSSTRKRGRKTEQDSE